MSRNTTCPVPSGSRLSFESPQRPRVAVTVGIKEKLVGMRGQSWTGCQAGEESGLWRWGLGASDQASEDAYDP